MADEPAHRISLERQVPAGPEILKDRIAIAAPLDPHPVITSLHVRIWVFKGDLTVIPA